MKWLLYVSHRAQYYITSSLLINQRGDQLIAALISIAITFIHLLHNRAVRGS